MAESKVRFDIEANSDAALKAIAKLRREFETTLAALKKQQGDIGLFKAAQQDAAKLERQIRALGKAGGDTSGLSATLSAQRAALAQQGAALQRAGVDTNALSGAQAKLRGQVEQVTRTFRNQSVALSEAAAAAASAAARDVAATQQRVAAINRMIVATRASGDAFRAQRAAAAAAAGVRGQVAVAQGRALSAAQAQAFANTQKLASAQNSLAPAIDKSGRSAAGASGQIAGYAAALLSVGAAVKGISAITTAGIQLQALESTLLFATGSAEDAASAYAFVREEAERLGLPLNVLGKQFGQLSAAAQGTSLQGDATRKIFSSVASAARVMGLQTFQVERALLAVQQIMSKGTVQAEELRGQLGEQIPGAFQIAARAMNVTTKELGDLLKAGEVLSEDFLPKFAAELQRTVDPAVPAAVKTYAAEIERLKNTFTIFLQEVGKSGALEAISAQVVIVTKKLQEMSDSGELKTAIDQTVNALSLLANGLAELADFAAKNSATIIRLAEAFLIFKAAQIGLGLATTIASLGGLKVAADGAAFSMARLTLATKAFARATIVIGVVSFLVDKLLEMVEATKAVIKAEDELTATRRSANNEADLAILMNKEYAGVAIKSAAEIEAASEKERAAYVTALKGAAEYYAGLTQLDRRSNANRTLSQAGANALSQVDAYRAALAQIDALSAERLKIEARQSAAIKVIKTSETATIKLAVDAQIEAVKKARAALLDNEKSLADIARSTAKFQQDLVAAGKAEGGRSLLDSAGEIFKVRQLLAGGDTKGALDQIDAARQGLLELAKAGENSPLFLQAMARELGVLALQAGEEQRAAAEENVQEQERKLLTLQSLAQEIETLDITANVELAEKEMQALHTRTQAFYDANPLIVKVVTQRQDDISLGLEQAPKKASGGLLRGPGTGTSDSILMYGSAGEYMVKAKAVRKLGLARMNAINQGRIPKFADGGLIARTVAGLPQISSGGRSAASNTINLTIPGVGTFAVQASNSVATGLQRAVSQVALSRGRRR